MEQITGPDDLLTQWVDNTYKTVQQIDGRYVVAFCHTPDRIYDFSAKQWTLLYHLSRTQTLEEACTAADLSINSAQRFLRSREYIEFSTAAREIEAVVRGFPAIRVLYETIRQFKGEIKLDDNQNKALDRLERLLMPKSRSSEATGSVNIQVNNYPTLPPDVVEKLKALGDERATINTTAA